MRFLLILLAMISGLSLADVAVAASPAHVVGQAEMAAAEASPTAIACPVQAQIARGKPRRVATHPLAPVEAGFARSCGVTIADQPHE